MTARKPAERCSDCPNDLRRFGRWSHGRCHTCEVRAARRRVQPVGVPRARQVPRAVLVDEVPLLRSAGLDNAQVAARLGMKPLSFLRACARAGIAA